MFDHSSEGERDVPLQTMVIGRHTGTVASATATGLTLAGTTFATDALAGREVVITSGAGAGQTRLITGNAASTLTLASAWAVAPDGSSSWMVRGVGEYDQLAVANTVVSLLDDDRTGVVVVQPDGGVTVVEPVGGSGTGGTSATYQVKLTRAPLATVTVRITAGPQLLLQLDTSAAFVDAAEGLAPSSVLILTFTTADFDALRTIRVFAVGDGTVEGQHVTLVAGAVTSTDTMSGQVAAGTGRDDEFTVAGTPFTPGALRGYLVRITGGTGAGQVRTIWTNLADTIVVEEAWDVLPDSTSTYVITGYTAPSAAGQVTGTVTDPDVTGDHRTITVDTILPTDNGGLTGALIRIVGATGELFYRVVASNTATTITVVDPWGTTAITTGTQVVVVGIPGTTVGTVPVLVHDADTAGVVVDPTGDSVLRLVEGALAGQFGATASYTVRLTRAPTGAEIVTVVLQPLLTSSLDIGGPNCGLPSGCSRLQVEFVAGAGQTVLGDGSLRLDFTASTWMNAQTVTIRAIQDTVVDGSDVQAFADRARRVTPIRGPLFVSGGDDPAPPVQLSLDGYLPTLLPGEASDEPPPITATTAGAIEPAQVDVLVIHNEDSPAADLGTLTSDRLRGLGMADDAVLDGQLLLGGIGYAAFEDLTVLLGYGADTFTVESTHIGTTTVDAGAGSDTVHVRTIVGHTRVLGGAGDDAFRIGSSDGLLDLLDALLAIDGGAGSDTAWLDDSADLTDNLGRLTQTSLTGLDMVAGTGGEDEDGRPRALDQVFTVTPRSGATEFTIVLSQVVGGVVTGIGAATFAVGTSAEAIRQTLQLLLFPQTGGADPGVSMTCGTAGATRCASSVYVWALGSSFVIGFRGEVNEDPLHPVTIRLDALGTAAPATDASRRDGVEYRGLEALNLALGSGHDVLTVRGTLPLTNVTFGAGDDRVYISSTADVDLTGRPQFLAGDLDAVEGTLNLDLGTGRHTLLVSDEGTNVADPNVLVTDVAAAAIARDADLAANGEIFVVGLAPAGISYRAAASGTFADGIRIWAGGGADTITIDGTHQRTGVRTTTWLNTGLGDDTVTVALTQGQDGFFVLNTQGPNDNVLGLATDLDDGDEPVSKDAVVSVTVNGSVVDPQRYVVSSRLDLVGLFDSLVPGDAVVVTVDTVTAAQFRVSGPFVLDLATLGIGAHELVGHRIWVNGVLVGPTSVSGSVVTIAAGTQRDGEPSHVLVEVTRRHTESFGVPQASGSDDDTVDATGSTLPLVIIGGQGEDEIDSGSGGDIVIGDRGRVLWFTPGALPLTGLGSAVLTAAQLEQLEAVAVAVSGHGGLGDTTDGVEGRLVGLVITVDPSIGGKDIVTTGLGFDTVLGGAGGDDIETGEGIGIVLADHGFVDFVLLDGAPADLDRIWSTDLGYGGDDIVTTGNGDDVVFGGNGADTITGGDGRNIVLGDNGRFTAVADETRQWGDLPMASGVLSTEDATIGGGDEITTGTGLDVVLGGALGDTIDVGAGNDLVIGDHGVVTWLVLGGELQVARLAVTDNDTGGADTIRGRGGEDVLIGGTDGDDIDAGTGRDLVLGDNATLDRTTTFGDHRSPRFRVLSSGQIYSTDLLTAGTANVTEAWQNDPAGATAWSDFRITLDDHADDTAADRFGDDYLAGGADDDMIFGQLGDDVIQGDGSIDGARVGATRGATGLLVITPSTESATDGDDYIEGGGGRDAVFGGLGRDDIIGGSSDLFSLLTMGDRPDAGDLLFGGAGTQTSRNNEALLHGRDSDTVIGDNGQVLRLVTVTNTTTGTTAYRTFTYDNYGPADVRLLPRAVVLLDYTPGGPDLNPDLFPTTTQPDSAGSGTAVEDVWGSDEVHGEGGDDTVYTGGGNDVVFGDAGDDDIVGGWGHDWISGGTGTDGIIGDDGRIFTSRNGSTEPLNGLTTANLQVEITTPGRLQVAILFPTNKLTKVVDITPFSLNGDFDDPLFRPLFANDVIFGGLDDDFLHGASGDDAVSGAEALATSFAARYTGATPTGTVETGWNRPFNDGTLLGFDTASGDFVLYDEYDARRVILLNTNGTLSKTGSGLAWFLSNDATDRRAGTTGTASDGDDAVFGAHGNDWLVGGTGRDTLWGGWGNDLLQADDLLTTDAGLNDTTDTDVTYEDRAYGGAGLDVLIGNTGGDRLIDWVGEFNSFIVPFAPFGAAAVSRQVLPGLPEFLYRLSAAQGADPTISQLVGAQSASRNGEPYGEIGVVTQKDDEWQDQTGGPRDPQPGNIPGGTRDVLRSAEFNTSTTLDGFFVDSGTFTIQGGALSVAAASLGQDAAAVFYVDSYLPIYYEIVASITTQKPLAGWKANAFIIFDYFSPTDFKFAGVDVSINKLVLGRRTAAGWVYDVQAPSLLKAGTFIDLIVAVNGTTVTVQANGKVALTHTYAPRMIGGVAYGLNKGMVGMGSDNARGQFDNVRVRVLPPQVTLDRAIDLTTSASSVSTRPSGTWTSGAGGLTGSAPAGQSALAVIPVPDAVTGGLTGGRVASTSWLEVTTSVATAGIAGLAFDVYAPDDLKVAVLDVTGQRVLLGHVTPRGGWVVDAVVPWALVSGRAYSLVLTLKGASASLQVDGQFAVSTGYNAGVVDGHIGMLARGSSATFSSARLRTDDPAYASTSTGGGGGGSGGGGGGGGTSPTPPTVSIGSASTTEGRSGQTTLSIPVTLSQASTETVTVVVTISGGTATSGTDYLAWAPAGITLTFAPGETTRSVTIVVVGDRTAEDDETVILSLGSAQGATIGTATGVGTIRDDDSRLTATALGPGGPDLTDPAALEAAGARLLREARDLWVSAGADPELLAGVRVVIESMDGTDLAQAVGRTIRLDADAAGWGWAGLGGAMSLLAVLVHELGHVLGLEHTDHGTMSATLAPGSPAVAVGSHPVVAAVTGAAVAMTVTAATVTAATESAATVAADAVSPLLAGPRDLQPRPPLDATDPGTDRRGAATASSPGAVGSAPASVVLLVLLLAGLVVIRGARRQVPRSGWPGDRVAV
ncbi:MAG TPA: Calx-beta domain-containing protein [Ornithinibacter sp.]|nr:Calx-beta domain-containing protein [Ornithinibacter sp.]